MVKNNFTHAWKLIYKEVNDYCNEYGIPNENRIKLYIKELEYISLHIHDVLPVNYNEQGIYPNDTSISKHTRFFSRNDSLPVARKNGTTTFWMIITFSLMFIHRKSITVH